MKPNRAVIKKPSGKPNSPKTEANPKPCSKPKIKITIGLHLLSLSKNIFSTAIKTIDKAISGSTISGTILIYPIEPSANVNVCATVKAEICQTNGLSLVVKKNKPKTKTIWSQPFGMI